jgi:hypothetical protein
VLAIGLLRLPIANRQLNRTTKNETQSHKFQ